MNENQQQPDLGHAVHYAAVTKGTPVYDAEGVEVGRVHQIVDNYREHILDGIVITDQGGEARFVDGPEVARTFERGVFLSIDASQVAELGPPEDGPGVFGARRSAGRLSRLFGGGWKRH
ncbi:MAG: hypothetical protein WBC01_11855 [Solirubrobacterales bacterium]|jgi:sporulation protein YlmC with PRC-barrel domain